MQSVQQWGVNAYLDLSTAIYIKNFSFHSEDAFYPHIKAQITKQ